MESSVIYDWQLKHWKSASSEKEVPWEKIPSHRQCTQFKHFTHSIQLIFESYFEIQHTADLHHSFSLSLLGLLYDLLAISSILDKSLDNFASKRSFKFSKSIKQQPECWSSASFSKIFSLSHSHSFFLVCSCFACLNVVFFLSFGK